MCGSESRDHGAFGEGLSGGGPGQGVLEQPRQGPRHSGYGARRNRLGQGPPCNPTRLTKHREALTDQQGTCRAEPCSRGPRTPNAPRGGAPDSRPVLGRVVFRSLPGKIVPRVILSDARLAFCFERRFWTGQNDSEFTMPPLIVGLGGDSVVWGVAGSF